MTNEASTALVNMFNELGAENFETEIEEQVSSNVEEIEHEKDEEDKLTTKNHSGHILIASSVILIIPLQIPNPAKNCCMNLFL